MQSTQDDFTIETSPPRQRFRGTPRGRRRDIAQIVTEHTVDDDLRRIVKHDVIVCCWWMKTAVKVVASAMILTAVFSTFTFCVAWLMLVFRGI